MKIKLPSHELSRAISMARRSLPSHVSEPILACCLVRANQHGVSFTCGGDYRINASVDCDVTTEGACTVPARQLEQLANQMPKGEVTLTLDDKRLHLQCAGVKASIPMMYTPEDWPSYPDKDNDFSVSFDAERLYPLLRALTASAGKNKTVVYYGISWRMRGTGVLLSASENSWRSTLAEINYELVDCLSKDDETDLVIPRPAIDSLYAILDGYKGSVWMRKSGNSVSFSTENWIITTPLRGEQFPPFEKLLEKLNNGLEVSVDRKEFSSAIRRTMAVLEDDFYLEVSVCEDGIVITGDTANGSMVQVIPYEADQGWLVGLNAHFLTTILDVMVPDKVQIRYHAPNMISVVDDETGFIHLMSIMQLRRENKG